jgi:glycerol uptake facilitator-like aquaporin
VSVVAWRTKALSTQDFFGYTAAQIMGAVSGVWLTHLLFELPIMQMSSKPRHGLGIWVSELVSTLVLLGVIQLGAKHAKDKLPMLVALTVTAGYWFTSSTFFANPAVTIARSITNTFVGIAPLDILGFITAQLAAVFLVLVLVKRH